MPYWKRCFALKPIIYLIVFTFVFPLDTSITFANQTVTIDPQTGQPAISADNASNQQSSQPQTHHDATATFLAGNPLAQTNNQQALVRSAASSDQAEGEGSDPNTVYVSADFTQASYTFRIPKNGRIIIDLPDELPGVSNLRGYERNPGDYELGTGRSATDFASGDRFFEYVAFPSTQGVEVFTISPLYIPSIQIEIRLEIGDPNAPPPPASERVDFPGDANLEPFYIESNQQDRGVVRDVDGNIIGIYEYHRFPSGRHALAISRNFYEYNWANVNTEWKQSNISTVIYWTDSNRENYQYILDSASSHAPDWSHGHWHDLDAFIGDPFSLNDNQRGNVRRLMGAFRSFGERVLEKSYITRFYYEHLLDSAAQANQQGREHSLRNIFPALALLDYGNVTPDDLVEIVNHARDVWEDLTLSAKGLFLRSIMNAPSEAIQVLADLTLNFYEEFFQLEGNPVERSFIASPPNLPNTNQSGGNSHFYTSNFGAILTSPRVDRVVKYELLNYFFRNLVERVEQSRYAVTVPSIGFLVEYDGIHWDLEDFSGPITTIASAFLEKTNPSTFHIRDFILYMGDYIDPDDPNLGVLEDWIDLKIEARGNLTALTDLLRVYDASILDPFRSKIDTFLNSLDFNDYNYYALTNILNYLERFNDAKKHEFYQVFIPQYNELVTERLQDGDDEYHLGVDNDLAVIINALRRHENRDEFLSYYDFAIEAYNPIQDGESSTAYQARLDKVKQLFHEHLIFLMDISGGYFHGNLAFGSSQDYVDLLTQNAINHPGWTTSVTLSTQESGEAHGSNLQINWTLARYDEPLEFIRVLLHESAHTAAALIGRGEVLGLLAQDAHFNYVFDDKGVPSTYSRTNVLEHFAEMITYIQRDTRHWLDTALEYFQDGHPALLNMFLSVLRTLNPLDQPSENSLMFTYMNPVSNRLEREWITGRWVEGNEVNGIFEMIIDGQVHSFEYENTLIKSISVPPTNHAPQVPDRRFNIATSPDEFGQFYLFGEDIDGDDLELRIISTDDIEVLSVEAGPVKNSWIVNYKRLELNSFSGGLEYELVDPRGRRSYEALGTSDIDSVSVRLSFFGGPRIQDPVDLVVNSSKGRKTSIRVPGIDDYEVNQPFLGFVENQPQNGTVRFNVVTRVFEYIPNEGFAGVDTFTYFFNTGVPGQDTEAATITVNVQDHNGIVPISYDFDVVQSSTQEIFLDQDLLGGEFIITQMPAHGRIIEFDSRTGRLVYESPDDHTGDDVIRYQVNLGSELSEVAEISLKIIEVNLPPVAAGDYVSLFEDASLSFQPPFSDPDGDDLMVTITSHPSHGTLTFNQETQMFEFQPEQDFSGILQFSYVVSDGRTTSEEAFVAIDVLPRNDPPVISEPQDQTLSVGDDFQFNFEGTDVDGDSLTYSLIALDGDGETVSLADLGITFNADTGELNWTPSIYTVGAYRLTVTVSDGESQTSADLDLLISDPFHRYDVNADGFITPIDALIIINYLNQSEGSERLDRMDSNRDRSITPNDVLRIINYLNDQVTEFEEAEGEGSSNAVGLSELIDLLNDRNFKSAFGKSEGEQGFDRAYDFDRNGKIDYDDIRLQESQLALRPTNVAPVALPESIFPSEDESITWPPRVTDADGDNLQIRILEYPQHGELVYDESTGLFTYTPEENYHGPDEFRYEVFDGLIADESTITIDVQPVNDEAVIDLPSTIEVYEDGSVPLVASFSDVEDDRLQVVLKVRNGVLNVTGAAYVQITGYGSNELTITGTASEINSLFERQIIEYSPDENFSGLSELSMSVLESGTYIGTSMSAEILVGEVNDMPIVVNPFSDLHVFEDDDRMKLDLSMYFKDIEDSPLYFFVDDGSSDRLNASVDGHLLSLEFGYDQSGIVPIVVSACEEQTQTSCTSQTFDVFIQPVDDPPIISDIENVTFDENQHREINLGQYVQDVDSGDFEYELFVIDANGIRRPASDYNMTMERNGWLKWTPDYTQAGTYNLEFKVTSGEHSVVQPFQIIVNNVNRPPVAHDMNVSVDEDGVIEITPDIDDPDGESGGVSWVGPAAHGTVRISESGTIIYVPNANFHGEDRIEYEICDSSGDCDRAFIDIVVNLVNDPPVISDIASLTILENSRIDIDFAHYVSDVDTDNEDLVYRLVMTDSNGTRRLENEMGITLTREGYFIWTPSFDMSGVYDMLIEVSDGTTTSSTRFQLTVNDVNRPPVANNMNVSVDEDGVIEFAPDVSDPDNDNLEIRIVRHPTDGTLVYDETIQKFRFTPSANFNGNLNFTYRAQDQDDVSADATVNITVNAVQDPPTATSFASSLQTLETRTYYLRGSDVDGDRLSYRLTNVPPELRVVSFNRMTGRLVVQFENRPSSGRATLAFVANDGLRDSAVATIRFTVTAPPITPMRDEQMIYSSTFGFVKKVTDYRPTSSGRVKVSESFYQRRYVRGRIQEVLLQQTTFAYYDRELTQLREKRTTIHGRDGSRIVWREMRARTGRTSHHVQYFDRYRRMRLNRNFNRIRPRYESRSGLLQRLSLLDTSQTISIYRSYTYLSRGRRARSSTRYWWRR